ncbi:MAG: hypothetical protein H7A40_03620 [Chlamydiales bacterium]|nr:hypothetical protein [Chlamydiales bacterium]
MGSFSKKKMAAVLGCLLIVSASASTDQNCMPPKQAKPMQEDCNCNPCITPPDTCAYNAPVVLNPCAPTNLYVTGSFIYWRASADYLTYAFLDNEYSPNPLDIQNNLFSGETVTSDFKYKPGYKVGLGYKIPRDHWDVYVEYTRLHQTVNSFQGTQFPPQHIHAAWLVFINPLVLGEEFRSASTKWQLELDILDAEVGRDFFCGRNLTLRPSFGLRNLWLEQDYNIIYTPITTPIQIQSLNKSHSWGIGPRAALNADWNIFWGFKICGDIGASLLHVQERISVKQINPGLLSVISSDVSYSNKSELKSLKPILDLSLGLEWGHELFQEKCFFSLRASYDYSFYWDQGAIQLGRAPLVAPGLPIQVVVGNVGLGSGNLSFEGPTLKARLDF